MSFNVVRRQQRSATREVSISFDWGDATPKPLMVAPADKMILSIRLVIEEEFDGVGSALMIGDSGDADRLMLATDNDPASIGEYEVAPDYAYLIDTQLTLSITPGSGASTGGGTVLIEIET